MSNSSFSASSTEQDRQQLGFGAKSTINAQSISRQRLLGGYYTPEDVAENLVRWALNRAPGNLLDPSFGGCAFLKAGAKVLEEMGVVRAGASVFGVDVDASCVEYVRQSGRLRETNCIFADFLTLSPNALSGAPFRAVVGNPPYVRHHWLKENRRVAARRITDQSSVPLPKTASLWAYFVVHALAFLESKGRLAMLVPESILQADYAVSLRSFLASRFRRVRLIHVRERLFSDTNDPVVLIAGEDFGTNGSVEVVSVDSAQELNGILNDVEVERSQQTLPNGRRVLPRVLEAMDLIESTGGLFSFSSLASARIGMVTGANNHFIRSADELRELGIPPKARSGIVSRTKWLSGLDFTPKDHLLVAQRGARAYLVRPTPALENNPGIVKWILEGEVAQIHERYKCRRRKPWYRVNLSRRPDAFITSTRCGPPILILNRTRFRCTNTLYAVRFDLPERVQPESLALGFLTSYVALWSEINGRRYGGGVLKIDLSTLSELPVPIVAHSDSAFNEANCALRNGDEDLARSIADRAVLCDGLGISSEVVESIGWAIRDLALQRIPQAERS